MEFRQSQTEDLDQIVRIAEDAKAFLRANGVSQWQRGTYPDRALFASDVASGIGWVLADGDRVCAVCAVKFDDELSYRHLVKGAWLTGDGAAYATIHRSAVATACRGQGVAGRLFAFVCDLAASRGVGSVRVDTHPDNRAMRAALEKAGFVACGELLLDRCEEAGDPRDGYGGAASPVHSPLWLKYDVFAK